MQNIFAAGSATALLLQGQNLIGTAQTLTDSSIDATLSAEEIRAASGNLLFGKYFHTSNLSVTLTDAMFNLSSMAMALGSKIESGGTVLQEESLVVGSGGTTVTLTKTPVAICGSIVGWYKLPADIEWKTGQVSGSVMNVSGVSATDEICVKYFYHDPNATHFTAKAQYVPEILHVILLIDLFKGSSSSCGEIDTSSPKAGRLLVDIPQLQMDGNQNLALTSTGAATTSLTGSALAVEDGVSCSSDPYYGTFTQQLFNTVWQEEITALAIANGELVLEDGESASLEVKAIRAGTTPFTVAPVDLTYTVVSGGTYVSIVNGVVTGDAEGEALIKVELIGGSASLDPAFASVTVLN